MFVNVSNSTEELAPELLGFIIEASDCSKHSKISYFFLLNFWICIISLRADFLVNRILIKILQLMMKISYSMDFQHFQFPIFSHYHKVRIRQHALFLFMKELHFPKSNHKNSLSRDTAACNNYFFGTLGSVLQCIWFEIQHWTWQSFGFSFLYEIWHLYLIIGRSKKDFFAQKPGWICLVDNLKKSFDS